MSAINLVEAFIVSADTSSFSATARRLGLTPAAVSKNVARLETQIGLRLFQRSTRRLTLTSGGERFLQEVTTPRGGFGNSDAGVSGFLPVQNSNRRAEIHEETKT